MNIFHIVHELLAEHTKKALQHMDLWQGKFIRNPIKQELSSLFLTHHLDMTEQSLKGHGYIPYGLGVTDFHIIVLSYVIVHRSILHVIQENSQYFKVSLQENSS